MKTYTILTLGGLIDALRALPEGSDVRGFSTEVHSYRGWYERPSLEPLGIDIPTDAHRAADYLAEEIGGVMGGWKGGEYPVRADLPVYLAEWGKTGPNFIGLEEVEPGVFEPVLLDNEVGW